MTVWSLNNFYTQSFYPQMSGAGSYAFLPSFSSIPSSIFAFGTPRYDVFNSNIFSFTPPTNFSYIPQAHNPFSYMGQLSFSPFFSRPQLFTPGLPSLPSLPSITSFSSNSSSLNSFLNFLEMTKRNPIGSPTNSHSRVSLSANPTVSNALQIARSQIGVKENGSSNNSTQINEYRNGVQNGAPWCASFVSWCYGKGQNSNNTNTFGYSASSQDIRRQAQSAGVYSPKTSGYTPVPGDLMILKYSESRGHIGIVESVNKDGSFTVIEGNQSNQVKRVQRSMNTENLDGFVRMNEWLSA